MTSRNNPGGQRIAMPAQAGIHGFFIHPSPSARDSGFTLLEMLVVIAIMGITLALLANFRQPRSQWLATQSAARQVADALRDAGGQAIAQGHPVAARLPRLSVPVAVQPPSIVFCPDGSSSGGQILLGKPGAQITLRVDWLTGRVTDAN